MSGRSWKPRELEILPLLAEGLTNREIGARLHLSPDTVRWYNKQIFEKLGIHKRAQVIARARETDLFDLPITRPVKSPLRYVANDGVHIAYQTIGNGPIDILFVHGFLSHLELAWENPEFSHFFEQLARFARVILFDKRGVGLSDRIQGAPSLETTMEDARRVLDAVGSVRAFILGTSEGGAVSVLLAATYPERVLGLILYGSTPKVLQTNGEPSWAEPPDRFTRMIETMQKSWGQPWAVEGFAPSRANDENFRAWWAMVLRAASSPSSVKAVLTVIGKIDIRPLLPQVRVRTLVIHKTHDRMVPIEAGRYFAAHLPNATWLELPGADHIYFIENESLLAAIEKFCLEPLPDPVDTWIAIVLYAFADGKPITDLTAYHPKQILIPQDGIAAEGFLVLFDSPSRAIQCARQLSKTAGVGLHVGECLGANGNPIPSVLETVRHIAILASPDEILLTPTLYDILAGSSLSFEKLANPASSSTNILYRLI